MLPPVTLPTVPGLMEGEECFSERNQSRLKNKGEWAQGESNPCKYPLQTHLFQNPFPTTEASSLLWTPDLILHSASLAGNVFCCDPFVRNTFCYISYATNCLMCKLFPGPSSDTAFLYCTVTFLLLMLNFPCKYVFLSELLNFHREGNEDTSFFIKFFFKLFIYFWLCCVCCCEGFSLILAGGGYSPVAVCRLPLWWLLLLHSTGSRACRLQ